MVTCNSHHLTGKPDADGTLVIQKTVVGCPWWNPMVWPFKLKLLSINFLWYCLLCCTKWLFESCGWNPMVLPFKWKLLSSTFLWYRLLCCTKWFEIVSLRTKSVGLAFQMKALWYSLLFNVTACFSSFSENEI